MLKNFHQVVGVSTQFLPKHEPSAISLIFPLYYCLQSEFFLMPLV
jgi:hypothetical protein